MKLEIENLKLKISELESCVLKINPLENKDDSLEVENHVSLENETLQIKEHSNKLKCELCNYETTSQKGLNIHKGVKHKKLKDLRIESSVVSTSSTSSDSTPKPPVACARSPWGCLNSVMKL